MNEQEFLARFPNASRSTIAKNCGERVRAAEPQSTQGHSLERVAPREDKGGTGAAIRYRIRFTVYAVRPCDWDGYHIKELQDMLVRSGFLPDDNWRILQGEVVSEKACSKEDEKTVIEIERVNP